MYQLCCRILLYSPECYELYWLWLWIVLYSNRRHGMYSVYIWYLLYVTNSCFKSNLSSMWYWLIRNRAWCVGMYQLCHRILLYSPGSYKLSWMWFWILLYSYRRYRMYSVYIRYILYLVNGCV